MSGIKDTLVGIGSTVGKSLLVSELKKQGKKLRDKDANTTGKDDAAGRSLEALADAVDAIEFTDNPKSLNNIGKALEAAGKKLQTEAQNAQSDS